MSALHSASEKKPCLYHVVYLNKNIHEAKIIKGAQKGKIEEERTS